jgi:orotate phosphoribosyltransferase
MVEARQKVVVIEDLVSTGQSSLKAVAALRDMECEVLGMLAIFTYNFPIAHQRFEEAKVSLHTLTDYNILVEEAVNENYVKSSEMETLNQWRKDPAAWAEQFK